MATDPILLVEIAGLGIAGLVMMKSIEDKIDEALAVANEALTTIQLCPHCPHRND